MDAKMKSKVLELAKKEKRITCCSAISTECLNQSHKKIVNVFFLV